MKDNGATRNLLNELNKKTRVDNDSKDDIRINAFGFTRISNSGNSIDFCLDVSQVNADNQGYYHTLYIDFIDEEGNSIDTIKHDNIENRIFASGRRLVLVDTCRKKNLVSRVDGIVLCIRVTDETWHIYKDALLSQEAFIDTVKTEREKSYEITNQNFADFYRIKEDTEANNNLSANTVSL